MRALTVTAVIRPDHTLTAQVPSDIPTGLRTAIVVLEDAQEMRLPSIPLMFQPHAVGPADPTCTYRREDLYGDDAR